jgi:hypothetical protein
MGFGKRLSGEFYALGDHENLRWLNLTFMVNGLITSKVDLAVVKPGHFPQLMQ